MRRRASLAVLGVLLAASLAAGRTLAQPPTSEGGTTPTAPAPSSLLAVQTSVDPTPTFFGDPVTALVTVDLDSASVRAASVQVIASFAPYVESAPPSLTTLRAGDELTELYRYTIQCLSDDCLPSGAPRTIQLVPVEVSARAGAGTLHARSTWPPMEVVSRLQASDLAGKPPFRSAATMPPPVYAISPGLLSDLLIAAGALLAAGAALLVGVEAAQLLGRLPRRGARALTPLEAALRYTREAAERAEASDRRKALGLLAETLAAEGHQSLAAASDGVAWSESPPSTARTEALADEVTDELGVEAP